MKTFFRSISVLTLVMGLQTALVIAQAQEKSAGHAKPASGKAASASQGDPDKQSASAKTSEAAADNKSKDPLENMRFRNLGPAVGEAA